MVPEIGPADTVDLAGSFDFADIAGFAGNSGIVGFAGFASSHFNWYFAGSPKVFGFSTGFSFANLVGCNLADFDCNLADFGWSFLGYPSLTIHLKAFPHLCLS